MGPARGLRPDRTRSTRIALDLARMALRADDASAALEEEHRDRDGRVPEAIAARTRELARMSDGLAAAARRTLR